MAEYQLWYRDPRQVIHNILGNPEFASGIDYTPHRDFQDENTGDEYLFTDQVNVD